MFDVPQQDNVSQGAYTKPFYKRPLLYISAVLLCSVAVGLYAFASFYRTIVVTNDAGAAQNQNSIRFDRDNPMPAPDPNRLTVLILGNSVGRTDGSIQDTGALLTDSMEIFTVDTVKKKAALVSIPRDLQVEMFGADRKINEAYVRGLERGMGIPYVSQLISRITGLYVNKTVVFDLDAFKTIVDDIGGIDIHLDKPFLEPTQWTYPFSLPAGNDHLTGEQALYYVRSRYASSDYDRARRQQQVMFAIREKVVSLGFIANPFTVASVLSGIKSDIKTDFQIWDIYNFLHIMGSFDGAAKATKTYVITSENLVDESKTDAGEFILVPKGGNFNGFHTFFKNIFH